MATMIDYHCHILHGIDDGAKDLRESLEMARLLVGTGFREVCCTPHCIRGSYDTTPRQVQEEVAALQEALDEEGIGLRLQPGMEYYLDEFFLDLADLQPLGQSRLVLVEAPGQANAEIVREGLEKVLAFGKIPLIAHPERSEIFFPNGIHLKLKTQNSELPEGVLFQANLASFTGFYGPQVQRRAYDLLRAGRYAALGSDGHDAGRLAGVLEAWQGKMVANPVLQQLAGSSTSGDWKDEVFGQMAWA